MKNTLTLCALALATSAFAQTSGDRIHKIIPNTTEQFGPGYKNLSTELHVNDIDSITFDVDAQTFTVYGGYNPISNTFKTATYSLEKLIGFDFTYLADGVMPSTCLEMMQQPDRNAFRLKWRPVEGAAGYQIKYGLFSLMTDDWDNNPDVLGTITVGADSTDTLIEHLDYSTMYKFAIRTLSPKGEGYHSEWSTRANFRYYMWNYLGLTTDLRYVTPEVLNLKETKTTEATLSLHPDFDPSKYDAADADTIRSHFEIKDNRFVIDKIRLTKTLTGETKDYPVTEADITAGEIKLTGLDEGCYYTATAYNSDIPWPCDAPYNTVSFSTKVESSTPIIVASSDLGQVLSEYMDSSAYKLDQVFYLEGGKTYTINSPVSIIKGFTLATDAADLAAGKRAKVEFVSGTGNFRLGHERTSGVNLADNIHPIIFKGIDFSVTDATNFGSGNASGNYFINTSTTAYDFNIEALEIKDCTFQGFIRGFMRLQGENHNINRLNVDGNVFYNCGYYDKNGGGYAWFTGSGRDTSNMFNDFRFTNNTIYDSPRAALVSDSNKSLAWDENTKWNIRIENNTFINFSTRTTGRVLIDMRFLPGGSYMSVQRNLFALAADDADNRNLYNSGANLQTICGSGEFSFDVKDNYSVGCRDSHLKDDGIFTGNAFSSKTRSFGAFPTANKGTAEDLIVKVGTTPLKATDLFTNPNPPYTAHDPSVPNALDHAAPDSIFEALRYRQTPEVLNHEIYTLNIGDPRWRK